MTVSIPTFTGRYSFRNLEHLQYVGSYAGVLTDGVPNYKQYYNFTGAFLYTINIHNIYDLMVGRYVTFCQSLNGGGYQIICSTPLVTENFNITTDEVYFFYIL